jgi:ubiquinone/menaquinone biosynthesis C-methylase UbiE
MKAFRPLCRERIAGVDRSAGMLTQARTLLSVGEGAPFELSQGDALQLPFKQSSFDLLTCFGAFGHILEKDEPAMVAEVSRVLRPGGKFVFITSDMPPLFHPARLLPMGFNAAMRIRNALIKPEFVMYYLTFLLPRARDLLGEAGFTVDAPFNVLPPPFSGLRLVVATKG